jgi:hypothetical protein
MRRSSPAKPDSANGSDPGAAAHPFAEAQLLKLVRTHDLVSKEYDLHAVIAFGLLQSHRRAGAPTSCFRPYFGARSMTAGSFNQRMAKCPTVSVTYFYTPERQLGGMFVFKLVLGF